MFSCLNLWTQSSMKPSLKTYSRKEIFFTIWKLHGNKTFIMCIKELQWQTHDWIKKEHISIIIIFTSFLNDLQFQSIECTSDKNMAYDANLFVMLSTNIITQKGDKITVRHLPNFKHIFLNQILDHVDHKFIFIILKSSPKLILAKRI